MLLACCVAGCGSDLRARRGPRLVVDQRHAGHERPSLSSALLRREDLVGPWKRSTERAIEVRCRTSDPFQGARAIVSAQFQMGEEAAVVERVARFATAGASRRALGRLGEPASSRCYRRSLRREIEDQANGRALGVAPIRAEPIGSFGHAIRYEGDTFGAVGRVHVYIDTLEVSVLTGVAVVAVVMNGEPLQPETYERVTNTMLRRLRQAVAP